MQPHLLAFMIKEHSWAPKKGQERSLWDFALVLALIQPGAPELLKGERRQQPALDGKVIIC